jgi:hypothetical protein
MSGDNGLLTTLLMGAAVIGTGGAALGAIAPAALGGAAATATTAAVPGFFAANAGIFSAIGGVASAGLNIMQGAAAQDAAEFERQQILERNEQEKVQYAIDNADRERKLADILSTQTAIFGARGLALGTGVSGRANEVSQSEGNRGDAISSLDRATSQRQLITSASQKRKEGKAAFTTGVGTAGKSLLSSYKAGSFDALGG